MLEKMFGGAPKIPSAEEMEDWNLQQQAIGKLCGGTSLREMSEQELDLIAQAPKNETLRDNLITKLCERVIQLNPESMEAGIASVNEYAQRLNIDSEGLEIEERYKKFSGA
ncbi:MAG: hypothetical protein ABIT47_04515 [Candidatus Paceibacterota bacterium]